VHIKPKELDFLQYKSLVASIHDVVFQTDAAGRWLFLNDSWSRIMGYKIDESIGKPFYGFIHPDDVEKSAKLFKPMMTGAKQHCSYEVRYTKKSGAFCWVKVFAMLVKDVSGEIIGTQGTLQDVSVDVENRQIRKAAEAQILLAIEKERELNRLKSNFVSLASHEFRTPLAIMRSSIELSEIHLAKNRIEDSHLSKHIQTIVNEIDRLTELIEKVLTIGQIDSKVFTCNKEKIDLVLLIQETLNSLELVQKDKRTIRFVVTGMQRIVIADPFLLAHAITNLVSNALKYSIGKPRPHVELIFSQKCYRIIITDFGIGIPLKSQKQVAQAFYRADNVKAIKGTGLGIFIAKKFILLHGGSLTFSSVPDEGTIFTIKMDSC